MTSDVTIGLAFIAGLISFVSPCVLPLVPAYVGYMGGRATNQATGKGSRFGTFLHGVFFVLGFTTFFVSFGLLTAATSSLLTNVGIDIPSVLTRLGGAAMILFGLYTMKILDPGFRRMISFTQTWANQPLRGVLFTIGIVAVLLGYFYWAFGAHFPISAVMAIILLLALLAIFRKPLNESKSLAEFWSRVTTTIQYALATDTRQMNMGGKQGYAGSYGMGIVFSAGWTPCIGPLLASVIALASSAAASGESLWRPAILYLAYSLGLGIPFLLTALAFNQSVSVMNKLKRHMHKVELTTGAFLILVGILLLTGSLTTISRQFANSRQFLAFSTRLEGCTVSIFEGNLRLGSYGGCVQDGSAKVITPERYIQAVQKTDKFGNVIYVFPHADENIPVGLKVGERAPNFTLKTLDGKTVSLEDYRGRPVLINFWATWCVPCRKEMPEFQVVYDLQKEYGFTILAVDFRDDPEQVQAFIDEIDVNFTVLLDESGEVNENYNIVGYPTSFILDGNGVIAFKNNGELTATKVFEVLDSFQLSDEETAVVIE